MERNCPFLDGDEMKVEKLAASKASARKYDLKFRNKTKIQKEEDKAEKEGKERTILQVLKYEFTSCPVATLMDNRGLTSLIDLINWSVDMHTSLFDGGLLKHTNYYFECYRTVTSEQKKIEHEEMKESQAKNKPKKVGTKSKGRVGKR